MFEVFCPAHGGAVLLSIGRIEGIDRASHGVAFDWRCWCGHVGRTIGGRTRALSGSGAESDPADLPEAS